jgi:hypothetical protein
MGRAKSSARKSSAKLSSDAQSSEASSDTKSSDTKTKSGAARKSRKVSGKKSPSNGSPKNTTGRTSESPAADAAESAKIEPLPEEVAEPDETMSPEEIERARKRYLLKRCALKCVDRNHQRGDPPRTCIPVRKTRIVVDQPSESALHDGEGGRGLTCRRARCDGRPRIPVRPMTGRPIRSGKPSARSD